jgi:aspartyl-tRNA(Asn)/glutamyl-tRNA(Gln) amidotransferase subunit A
MNKKNDVIYSMSLCELKTGLVNKEFSSTEILNLLLDRISTIGKPLNAFITITADQAIDDASKADKIIAKGNANSLTGLPIAHKDLFCTRDVLTSCASRILNNFISPYDAAVVEKLSDAGAVMVGKTNMDEFAMGSSNETSYFGSVHNPWNDKLSPGGSSGGSAAAVAARLVPAATGTDTGGSIRQPAALTGTTGIKPTYGRVSRYGMVAFASSLDQGGVITRSSEDAALLLGIISGFDERDSTSSEEQVPDYLSTINNPIKGLRIGYIRQHFDEGLEKNNEKLINKAIEVFKEQGAKIIEIDMPNIDLSVPTYYVVSSAECSSNLSRFDGIRFGYRAKEYTDLAQLYCRTRGDGFGAEVKRRLMTGTYVLSAGYYDAYYLKAQKIRQLISRDFKSAFEEVDVILGPTTPTPAFALGEKIEDPITMYLNDIYTIGANLAGLPGMSIPCGFVDNLPIGLHIIGPHFSEEVLLRCAHQYQLLTDWHTKIPEKFE